MHFNYYIRKGEWQKTVEGMEIFGLKGKVPFLLPWHMYCTYAFFLLFVLTFDLSIQQEGKNTWSDFVILVTFYRDTVTVESDDSFYVQGGEVERLHKVLLSSLALLPNARSRNGKWTKSLLFLLLFSLASYFSSVRRNSRRPRGKKNKIKILSRELVAKC